MHLNSAAGRAKTIAMILASSLHCPSDADAAAARHIVRLLNLGFAVLILLANGPLTRAAIDPAARAGLCTPAEAAILTDAADPLAVIFGWVLTLTARLCHDRRALSEPTLQYLQAVTAELRGHASEALLYTQTQLPYAAVQLSSAVVFAFIAQASTPPLPPSSPPMFPAFQSVPSPLLPPVLARRPVDPARIAQT
jgi:hypothetical protein